jgi:hypothetical protein
MAGEAACLTSLIGREALIQGGPDNVRQHDIRRKGDERDARLALLRKEGIPLLNAISHRYGFYHSGPHAGQILIVIGYQDIATHERAMQSMSKDEDWKRIAGEVEKIASLQESYVTVITEEQ